MSEPQIDLPLGISFRPGRLLVDLVRMRNHLFADDPSGETIQNINELIPTFEEIDQMKDSYIVQQGAQELAAHVYQFALPWPVKLGMEVYSFYDYFTD